MKGRILIVEDETLYASKIQMMLDQQGYECTGLVENSEDALNLLGIQSCDLILMDININGSYDGIELTEMIRSKFDIPVIFITSNDDDLSFNRATRTNPDGFLIKPFSDVQLQRSIELALKKTGKTDNSESNSAFFDEDSIFIKKKNSIRKVEIDEIYFLEADGRYCRVYTKGEMYLVRQSLKDLKARLNNGNFISCHRSYVVNISKVKYVNLEEDLLVLEERTVPLSRREKDKLLDRLNYLT